MINLAWRDVSHGFGRYVATGLGLGLLIGVTLSMAGVLRGMIADGRALLKAVDVDLWVVQRGTLGPFAEPSTVPTALRDAVEAMPGVAAAGAVAYATLEARHGGRPLRVLLAGYEPGRPGGPAWLVAGRPIGRARYEMVADERTGLRPGDQVTVRRWTFTVVGLTRGLRSAAGDPVAFVTLRDAQDVLYLPDNDALHRDRRVLDGTAALNPPGAPGVRAAVEARLLDRARASAVVVRLAEGHDAGSVTRELERWLRYTAWTGEDMERILIGNLVATAARQIGLFLLILAAVSTAVIALTVYSMTQTKLREIAILKLVGTPDRTIVGMIVQEALGLGLIGFVAGKLAATLWAPMFPKHVVLLAQDTLAALAVTVLICVAASAAGVHAALRVDPATAIGG